MKRIAVKPIAAISCFVLLLLAAWCLFIPSKLTLIVTKDGVPYTDQWVSYVYYEPEVTEFWGRFVYRTTYKLGETDKQGVARLKGFAVGMHPIRIDKSLYNIRISPSLQKHRTVTIAYEDLLFDVTVTVTDPEGTPLADFPFYYREYAYESDELAYITSPQHYTDEGGQFSFRVHAGSHEMRLEIGRYSQEFGLSIRPEDEKIRELTLIYHPKFPRPRKQVDTDPFFAYTFHKEQASNDESGRDCTQRRRGIATNSQAKGPDSDETPESRITGTEEAILCFGGESFRYHNGGAFF